jgi:hypothetical protein
MDLRPTEADPAAPASWKKNRFSGDFHRFVVYLSNGLRWVPAFCLFTFDIDDPPSKLSSLWYLRIIPSNKPAAKYR